MSRDDRPLSEGYGRTWKEYGPDHNVKHIPTGTFISRYRYLCIRERGRIGINIQSVLYVTSL